MDSTRQAPEDHAPAEGPSFPVLLRGLAIAAVVSLGWLGVEVFMHPAQPVGRNEILLLGMAAVVVVAGLWHMLTARTRIDATHITQTGLWTRRLALDDVRRVELMHIPGLGWLIAPRVRLRTAMRGSYQFHATDRRVLDRLWALALSAGAIRAPAAEAAARAEAAEPVVGINSGSSTGTTTEHPTS